MSVSACQSADLQACAPYCSWHAGCQGHSGKPRASASPSRHPVSKIPCASFGLECGAQRPGRRTVAPACHLQAAPPPASLSVPSSDNRALAAANDVHCILEPPDAHAPPRGSHKLACRLHAAAPGGAMIAASGMRQCRRRRLLLHATAQQACASTGQCRGGEEGRPRSRPLCPSVERRSAAGCRSPAAPQSWEPCCPAQSGRPPAHAVRWAT